MNLPEDSDPLEIDKISENFEVLDGAVSQSVGNYRIGDIIYSSRNLEEETDGVWIACDQREVFVSEYPDLCSVPIIANRLPLFKHMYPGSEAVTSFEIGDMDLNAQVGDRYIYTKSVKNENWNTYAGLYDLETGKTASFDYNGAYIDDNILITSAGSTSQITYYVITDGTLSTRYGISNATSNTCHGIFVFKDKYIFLRNIASANSAVPIIDAAWEFVDTFLSGGTVTLKSSTYVLKPGLELYKGYNVAYIEDTPRCFDVPFTVAVYEWQDKLWALNCVRSVADTTKGYVALMYSDDAITWTQTDIMHELPAQWTGTYYITLGIVDDQLHVIRSWAWQHNVDVDGTAQTVRDRQTYVHMYNKNLDLVNNYEINGLTVTTSGHSICIRDGYMYIYGNYVPDRANTSNTRNAAYVFNLETGEVGYFDLPPYVFSDPNIKYEELFTQVHSTLFGPAVTTTVRDSYNTGTYGDCTGSRAITEYEFERGRLIAHVKSSLNIPVSMLILDNSKLQYMHIHQMPYNSRYLFYKGANTGIFVVDRTMKTRVLPYIKNGYIKALNEGDVE